MTDSDDSHMMTVNIRISDTTKIRSEHRRVRANCHQHKIGSRQPEPTILYTDN